MDLSHPSADHLFISYVRNDTGKEWAVRIQNRLTDKGLPCWRDETDIETGQKWPEQIPSAINKASALILIVSKGLNQSHWVKEEIVQAIELGLPIIPLLVEADIEPLPGTRTFQSIDFTDTADNPWVQLLDRLDGKQNTPPRRVEIAYLQDLLFRQELVKVAKIYTPLSGEQRQHIALSKVLPESCMPVEFELLHSHSEMQQTGFEKRTFYDVLDALRQAPRLALLGEPGAGKTFSLKRIAAEQAQTALKQVTAPIPLFVPLKQWIDHTCSLDNFIAAQSGKLEQLWPTLLQEKRLCLLLDGLNELPTRQRKEKMRAIRQLVNDQRLPVVAVSCRRDDFVDDLNLALDTLDIRPLDPLRIHTFIIRYMGLLDPQKGREAGEALFWRLAGQKLHDVWKTWASAGATFKQFWSVGDLKEELPEVYKVTSWSQDTTWQQARSDKRSLLRLAENPYLLTMMVAIARSGETGLPKNRAQLLASFIVPRK